MSTHNEIVRKVPVSAGLPNPIWQKMPSANRQVATGEVVMCDIYTAKAPLVDQGLIDEGVLYLQFGRLNKANYNSRTGIVRPNRIKWWTPYYAGSNPFLGSGEIGGLQYNVSGNRPNLFQITAQNQTSAELEYWSFIKTGTVNLFSGIKSSSGTTVLSGVPRFTGTKRGSNFSSPDSHLPTGFRYKKRPQRPMWRQDNCMSMIAFARLVIIRNGRVVGYGPNSEPLHIKCNQLPFSRHYIASTSQDQDSNMVLPSYVFTQVKGTILNRFRTSQ